jgi:peptide chain release factor subunit 1
MVSREELREIAKIKGDGAYFVSLYLNVNPVTNPKGDYSIWLKNARKEAQESFGKEVLKKVEKDLSRMKAHVQGNKRSFKKGLALISSLENDFWREYNLAVPLKSELVVDKMPYIKPLLDVLDNYRRYAVLLVDSTSARIFVMHLGEITEYGEMHTPDVPGKHKKGGWYALSQTHYERHVEYHVSLHLKDVAGRFGQFLKGEKLHGLILGGPEDAIAITRELLAKDVTENVIGAFHADMYENAAGVLRRAESVIRTFEKKLEEQTVSEIVSRGMKSEKAVLGLDGVLKSLQEGRILRLVMERDYASHGYQCSSCGALWSTTETACPYCGGEAKEVRYLVDLAAQKAIEQGAPVEMVSKDAGLQRSGRIGAFLRY